MTVEAIENWLSVFAPNVPLKFEVGGKEHVWVGGAIIYPPMEMERGKLSVACSCVETVTLRLEQLVEST